MNYRAIFSLLFFSVYCFSYPPEFYLKNRHPINSHRYSTFHQALQLLTERNAKVVVETGTSRFGSNGFIGDGGSTIIFGDWACHNSALLYTVDISSSNMDQSKNASTPYSNNIRYIVSDSISFLKSFPEKIDFLYLDSYDYEVGNPHPSQNHHLKEIQAAYPNLHDNSVVMIDDCSLPKGGKGFLVIPYLIERGWKIIANSYQVILVKETSQ
ncbi:MAG: class I SAM-dependent methyltransferase [Verrucomicrobiota bacterium]|nr:class I SAM-dependent methyltransferase [Verrucomicrobiota bacterium]